jgi:6,7-dimethyl-8-ribityllumazine synthase
LTFVPKTDKIDELLLREPQLYLTIMQTFEGRVCPPPEGYITIVVAKFNKTISQRLLDGALAKLRQHKVHENDIRVVWVPGAYELPFVASYFARDEKCLVVICLGAVIKGETTHDQHISRSVSMAFGEIASKFGTPVIFGVLTCNTIEQANARSGLIESVKDKTLDPAPGNKGAEAAEAALEMIDLMTELPEIKPVLPASIPQMLSQMFGESNDDDNDFLEDDDDDDKFYLPPRRKTVKKSAKKKK